MEKKEPKIFQAIKDFHSAKKLDEQIKISKKLTELVLAPVGGAWKNDEVLAFGGEKKDLQKKGKKLFEKLFCQKFS